MRRPVLAVITTARGQTIRVKWTPEGLLMDTGHGWIEHDGRDNNGTVESLEWEAPTPEPIIP